MGFDTPLANVTERMSASGGKRSSGEVQRHDLLGTVHIGLVLRLYSALAVLSSVVGIGLAGLEVVSEVVSDAMSEVVSEGITGVSGGALPDEL